MICFEKGLELRKKSAAKIDERVLLIGEIINGIRVIKMYVWEKYFEKMVYQARKREIDMIIKLFHLRAINFAMAMFSDRIALFCTIAVYVWLGNLATADKIFSTVHFFLLIRRFASKLFPDAVFYTYTAEITRKRMEVRI